MGETGAKMIALMRYKNLSFLLQTAKGGRMNNTVTIALEGRSRR